MSVQVTSNTHVAQGTHVIFVVRHGCGERGSECAEVGDGGVLALESRFEKAAGGALAGGARLAKCLVVALEW